MAFLDKVKELAVSAAQTTGEKLEVAKISVDIKNEENKVRDILGKIGEKVYADYEAGTVPNEEIVDLCKKIDGMMSVIDELKEKTLTLKDKKSCVICGKELDEEDLFCKACGAKQPEEEPSNEEDSSTSKDEGATNNEDSTANEEDGTPNKEDCGPSVENDNGTSKEENKAEGEK